MKKILLPLVTLFVVSFMMMGMAYAVSVEVTTVPEKITPYGTTVITVTCDEDASGSITVVSPSPSSIPYTKPIEVTAGVPLSVNYPDDFSGSSSEVGEYQVTVYLDGEEFTSVFLVSFEVHVIPELPIVGTAGATVAMLLAVGLYTVKRRRLK